MWDQIKPSSTSSRYCGQSEEMNGLISSWVGAIVFQAQKHDCLKSCRHQSILAFPRPNAALRGHHGIHFPSSPFSSNDESPHTKVHPALRVLSAPSLQADPRGAPVHPTDSAHIVTPSRFVPHTHTHTHAQLSPHWKDPSYSATRQSPPSPPPCHLGRRRQC